MTQLATPHAVAAPMLPGVIRVVKLIGIVTATNRSTEVILELNTGDRISENHIVDVGPESSVVLLFSNGSTLSLKENTQLSIDEFLQAPFSSKKANLAKTAAEPTSSKTRLFVNYGSLKGSVKKLNSAGGSRYDIGSPIGIAGIRGTTFELVISESGSDYTGSFSIGEGSAFFISKNNNYLPLEGNAQVDVLLTDSGENISSSSLDQTVQTNLANTTTDAISSFNDFSGTDFDPTVSDPTLDSSGTNSTQGTSGSTSTSGDTSSSSSSTTSGSTTGDTGSTATTGSSTSTGSGTSDSSSSTTSDSSVAPPAQAESTQDSAATEPETVTPTDPPATGSP